MILNLGDIKEFPSQMSFDGLAETLGINYDGLSEVGSMRAEMNIMRGDNIYFCQGNIVCDARLECSRCLDKYSINLQGDIEFSIQEIIDRNQANPADIPENEIVISAGKTEVDISGPLREALILAIPVKPLCNESCRGICPVCGKNKNVKLCDCKIESSDSRWDSLRNVTIKQNHSEDN